MRKNTFTANCKIKALAVSLMLTSFTGATIARESGHQGTDATLQAQNAALKKNTDGKGFGPQSPRDLAASKGENKRIFANAPSYQQMNLCNIHFHKNAEHKGGEFTSFAGYGDGQGNDTGYKFSGKLTAAESRPLESEICKSAHGGLKVGDTLELHYVHSTAQITPGPSLKSCLSSSNINPQLRVEAVVLVLVNDPKAENFEELSKIAKLNGYHQAPNIPNNLGTPIRYAGSTTGPAYNEKGSPLQVSWSVRPKVVKVNAESVGRWCKGNVFGEDHAHGVRNLVTNKNLLSSIK